MLLEPFGDILVDRKRDVLLFARWRLARRALTCEPATGAVGNLLIYPSDPHRVIGAVGDDAMIGAIASHHSELPAAISILVADGDAAQVVERLGHRPVPLPHERNFPAAMARLIARGAYDCVIAMGADVLDGHYGADLSKRMLVTVDLAARLGLHSRLLGFSFNASPPPELAKYFAGLDPKVAINVRDPLSLARLQAFAGVGAHLVADSAFTLAPGTADRPSLEWIAGQRAQGRAVVGLNLHPLLLGAARDDPAPLIRAAAAAIRSTSRAHAVAWFFLPHDYRGAAVGDGGVLEAVHSAVADDPAVASRYFAGEHRAHDIKALAGTLDGVVTGRMHLAIAALGVGTPVLCAAYQDKFAGLYRHFGLDEETLLGGDDLVREAVLAGKLDAFIRDLPRLRATIAARWPAVRALAQANFMPLDSTSQGAPA